jgi:cytochrome c oxidase assembly factor CtaG
MTDKPRYRLRANSVPLSRLQWWISGVACAVAVVSGIVLPLVGKVALGGALMGLSALVIVFTITSASGRGPGK